MKAVKYLIIVCICCCVNTGINAQLGGWIKQKKEEAKQKVNNKIDQKTSEGIDKAVNAPEETIKKKKEKKKNKKEAATTTDTDATKTETAVPADEFMIATNITCATGKQQMEILLRDTDGVNSVSIDSGSGKLYLSAGGNKQVYETVVEMIRKNGFSADGKKPTVKANTCK